MIELTTREAAEAIGVPHSTLKGWIQKIPVPMVVDEDSCRRITPAGLGMLKRIKALRMEEGKSLGTIRRLLSPDASQTNFEPVQDKSAMIPGRVQDELPRVLVAEVVQAIQAQTDLAEKYARAAHHIGELEEKIRHLETSETETRRLLTDSSHKQAELEAECQALRQQLAEEQKARRQAEIELAQVREKCIQPRPWWHRWLSWSPA